MMGVSSIPLEKKMGENLMFKKGLIIDFEDAESVNEYGSFEDRDCKVFWENSTFVAFRKNGNEHFYSHMVKCARDRGIYTIPPKPLTLEQKAERWAFVNDNLQMKLSAPEMMKRAYAAGYKAARIEK